MSPDTMLWMGRILTGLFTLFMLFASIAPKFLGLKAAKDPMIQMGWDPKFILLIGSLELGCVILHLFPRTSFLGAVLMTAVLGGAIATQLRVENPMFSHVLFGVYLGLIMWGGLWLRDPAVRDLLPLKMG